MEQQQSKGAAACMEGWEEGLQGLRKVQWNWAVSKHALFDSEVMPGLLANTLELGC